MIHDIVCFFAMVAPTVAVLHQLYPASNGKRLLLLSLPDSQQESKKRSHSCAGLSGSQLLFGPSIDVE